MKRRTLVAAAGILAIAGSIPLSALAAEKTIVVGVTASSASPQARTPKSWKSSRGSPKNRA